MADPIDPERLDALESKLDAVRKANEPEPVHENHYTSAQTGWRMVTELVVGLLLGFGIGYALDYWLDTQPWFILIFTLFGFAGGVRAMMLSAEEIQKKNSKVDAPSAPSGQDKMYDDE